MKKHLFLLFFSLLCIIPNFSWGQGYSNVSSSGLVARFALDELPGSPIARDATAQTGNGYLVETGGSWHPKGGYDGGGALALVGSAYLDVPLNWQPTAFSFSFWLKPTTLFNYGQLTGAKARWGAFLFHSSSTGELYAGTDVANRIVTQPGVIQAGVWQHFVFTFSNGVGSIYKNGQLLTSKAGMAASQPWQGMGLGYLSAEAFYDEVRVYNRAITAQEVAGLYGYYEAEAIPKTQLIQANIGSSNGVTYAENLTQARSSTQAGSTVPFTVSVPEAGIYTVTCRYAAATDYVRTLSVYVNGVDVTQAQFPSTASWASWSTQTVSVALQSGTNTIAYRYDADDNGWVNLDYIRLGSAISPGFTNGSAAANALPAEIGVDKFTGTATFNALLHTVTIPGVSLPIALHYSAAGLQVDDKGGEVGANWSLQAGPSIRRQVRDLPDDIKLESAIENRYGWLRYPTGSPTPASRIAAVPNAPATFSASSCIATEQLALTKLMELGSLNHTSGSYSMFDTEPDIFTYSVPGYSGKFVFDETGTVRLFPYAPVQITPLPSATSNGCISAPAGELAGFTIKTPEGILYTFNYLERISQQTQATAPYGGAKYLLRHFWDFKINQYTSGPNPPSGPSNIDYTTGWLAGQITTPAAGNPGASAANTITLGYACGAYSPVSEDTNNAFVLGDGTTTIPDHTLVTRVLTSPQLQSITTATAVVTFFRELGENDNFHITSLTITSPLEQNKLLKSYTFLRDGRSLTSILLNLPTSTVPLYTLTYDWTAIKELPAVKGPNKDYWGFASDNKATTAIPRLYVYPQLLGTAPSRPAAPYRLYPATAYPNGSVVLTGADRRPAARLAVALAGTLTEVKFATGGKVVLEYEQNQFYDQVAQQSLPAGGLRIRTIKVQDPITQVESRRDYAYQEVSGSNTGVSSGVLLHLPRFAFALALPSKTQWADVTVRTTDEVAPDPFESRHIGYRQVTELVPGKGQVTTVFSVPGGADDNTAAGDAASNLPAWQRPVFGLARQANGGTCPTIAPLQAASELYPFAPAPNYDFCRGLPLTVQYYAEPTTGTAPGVLVRQENYAYQYTNVRPTASSVTGLRYEQLGDPTTPLYAYAKYSLLTDFLYTTRQQVIQVPVATGATNQTTIGYRYNSRGWLAAKITQGSDNTLTRTRYKYLSDYALPYYGATGALQAMSTRTNTEGVQADVVETISEIRPAGSTGALSYAGATLQTFTTSSVMDAYNNPIITPTYPYQLRRWQPAQPVASYDSVRVVNNTLYIPATSRLAATVLAVDPNLTPLSTRTESGRQVTGKHVGYAGSVPVLQIANATAAEVVFSDFEASNKPYSFTLQSSSNYMPYPTAAAARTGKAGLAMENGGVLAAYLPASTAAQYRFVFWAKAATATTSTVTLSSVQATSFTQTLTHEGSGQWKRYELVLPVATLTDRTSYQLKLQVAGTLQVDDALLLPIDASAASTTYDFTVGKTSDTDAQGRTSFYEYSPTGDLALVRDTKQNIVHQYQKVIPGQTVTAGLSFATTGTMLEGEALTFMAVSSLNGTLSYRWDFGDGTTTGYSNSTTVSHTYPTLGHAQDYTARLYITSQGTEYVYTQLVGINMQPLRLTNCAAGVIAFEDCSHGREFQYSTACNSAAPNPQTSATFRVTPSLTGNFTYRWQYTIPSDASSGWQDLPDSQATTSTINVLKTDRRQFRCWVANKYQEVMSDVFEIIHYKNDPNCP